MGKPGPKSISDHCLAEGCDRPYHGQGYCRVHYDRLRHHGDLLPRRPGPKPWLPRSEPPRQKSASKQQARLDRWRRVAELRAQGLTFREIGAVLGVSRQYAHQILARCPAPFLPRDTPSSACRATEHTEGR